MDFYARALQMNREGWFVVNCFQIAGLWRVNLQLRTNRGASTEYFSEYAEGNDPLDALEMAYANATTRYPRAGGPAPSPVSTRHSGGRLLSPAMEKQLERALRDLFFAVKMDKS